MKKAILVLAIVSQALFVFAAKPKQIFRVKNENVKMYSQAGTASPVLKSLSSTADIKYIRQFNRLWSIVTVDDQPGFVLTSELYVDTENVSYVKNGNNKNNLHR